MKYKNINFSYNPSNPIVQVIGSKEYGASKLLLLIARKLNLDKIISPCKARWREDILAMLVGKLIFPLNNFLLSNFHIDTILWECCGHAPNKKLDTSINGHRSLTKLLSRQTFIQQKLIDKHLGARFAILHDLTSWGEPLGPEELHAGLLTSAEGCPLGIEFLSDPIEGGIQKQINILVEKLKLKSLVLVTDFHIPLEEGTKIIEILAQSQIHELLNAKNSLMTPAERVNIYGQISHVKRTFKDMMIEGYFQRNHCVNALLTMLSYYLKWHMVQKLDTYFKKNKNSNIRSLSFSSIIEKLKSIRSQTVQIGNTIVNDVKSNLDAEQSEILTVFDINPEILFS